MNYIMAIRKWPLLLSITFVKSFVSWWLIVGNHLQMGSTNQCLGGIILDVGLYVHLVYKA